MAEPCARRDRREVRTVPERDRVPQAAIEAVVRQIVERFRPKRIILFGSYARGDPRPTSDVDLLVVLDSPLREAEQAVRICQSIDYHFGLDLHVRTPATLARRLALGDPFLREIVETGTVLYAAAGN
jgi:predicted nucleotidyltransferase